MTQGFSNQNNKWAENQTKALIGNAMQGLSEQAAGSKTGYARVSGDTDMTTPSREEIDAKLEAIEARMDARISTTLGKMEAFMAAADGREVVNQERFQKATADNATNRSILVGGLLTIVVTVVSVYFALKADNQALINNLIAATNTGAANGEFKAAATNDIKKLQEDLAKKQDKK